MNNDTLLQVFLDASRAGLYKGKTLGEWFAKWVVMPLKDLEKQNKEFLKILTTWVIRSFSARRKGRVPTGNLQKFAFPEDQKINLVDTLCAFVILTLRRRGLLESDVQTTDQFRKLLDAFDRAPKFTEEKK